jgi:NitT/TauT family transport system ATP-binding protein
VIGATHSPPRNSSHPEALAGRCSAVTLRGVSYSVDSKRHGSKRILQDINLDVNPGEFVSVMGSSGCGKTTLLNLIAGFMRPTSGEVECHGVPVRGPGPDRGVVFQTPALYPWMSVAENVMFGPKAQGLTSRSARRQKHAQARALLEEVGLAGHEDHKTYELSGGMRHRVAIARTLMNEPKLLLMDEPFAALDAETRADMHTLLMNVWQRHRSSVVFVTHDIEEGLILSDRAIVLSSSPGRVARAFTVDLPRPRDSEAALRPEVTEMRREIRRFLKSDRLIRQGEE